VLPQSGPQLCLLLALPRADCAPGSRAGSGQVPENLNKARIESRKPAKNPPPFYSALRESSKYPKESAVPCTWGRRPPRLSGTYFLPSSQMCRRYMASLASGCAAHRSTDSEIENLRGNFI